MKLLKRANIHSNLKRINDDKCVSLPADIVSMQIWCFEDETFFNIKYFLYHVPRNPKRYSIIFAIILQFDKVMFCECQFSRERSGGGDKENGSPSQERERNFHHNT